jgi:hypothetical protein
MWCAAMLAHRSAFGHPATNLSIYEDFIEYVNLQRQRNTHQSGMMSS